MSAKSEPLPQATIEVRIRKLGQIFNSLDPSPFTERDLDDDAEAYIVGWAREVDTGVPFRIVVHLPAGEAAKARERSLESAMGNYFAYRVGMLERDLSDLLRVGRRSLLIGIAVLSLRPVIEPALSRLEGWNEDATVCPGRHCASAQRH
jgi:hypothetical protein